MTETIRKFSSVMRFRHFEIQVTFRNNGHHGSWRVCETQSLDHSTHSEAGIPLGKRLTKKKLGDFVLNCVAQADLYLNKDPAAIGRPLIEVFQNEKTESPP